MSLPISANPSALGNVPGVSPAPVSGGSNEIPFADLVGTLMQETSDHQSAVGDSVQKLITGESDSIHDVVLTASKADLAFRLVMEVRNRLMNSYEEIMRMQI